jgi:hypothetical protein
VADHELAGALGQAPVAGFQVGDLADPRYGRVILAAGALGCVD